MITSRLTSKSQVTLPKAVRKALALQPGDELGYAIRDDEVVLYKANVDAGIDWDPFALFDEWNSKEDCEDWD